MTLRCYTMKERWDLSPQLGPLTLEQWPRFVLEDSVANEHWGSLFSLFPEFQIVLVDEADTVVASGNAIPLVWDGTDAGLPAGWDGALAQGVADRQAGRTPTALCALSITVAGSHQGQGLSRTMIQGLRRLAARHGLPAMMAPVRPSLKSRYPLIPMARYVQWRRPDGLPFDPWLRTHVRVGARFVGLAPASMVVPGSVAQWEEWTGMRFPESGEYVVPGALCPVTVNVEEDWGRYVEDNVWVLHTIGPEDAE